VIDGGAYYHHHHHHTHHGMQKLSSFFLPHVEQYVSTPLKWQHFGGSELM
jgi:hypothetical protein